MEIITEAEKAQIEARLSALRQNRPMLAERIADARALGDLRENSEYHAAREQQGLEEAEIRRLEDRLARAQVVDESRMGALDTVFLGSVVFLKDLTSGREEAFRLVGEASGIEAEDVVEVTTSSPMGEALFKARVGETISVRTPRGIKKFEIVRLGG